MPRLKIFDYLKNSSVETIVIAARWVSTFHEERFDNGEGGVEVGDSFDSIEVVPGFVSTQLTGRRTFAAKLWRSGIERFMEMGKKVVLVYPVPEAGWNVPDRLAKQTFHGDSSGELTTGYDKFLSRNKEIIDVLDSIKGAHLTRVKPHAFLCNSYIPNRCVNALGGQVFYYDDDHLSLDGAALVAPAILKAALKNGL